MVFCRGICRGQSPQADCDRRFWRRTGEDGYLTVTPTQEDGEWRDHASRLGLKSLGTDPKEDQGFRQPIGQIKVPSVSSYA